MEPNSCVHRADILYLDPENNLSTSEDTPIEEEDEEQRRTMVALQCELLKYLTDEWGTVVKETLMRSAQLIMTLHLMSPWTLMHTISAELSVHLPLSSLMIPVRPKSKRTVWLGMEAICVAKKQLYLCVWWRNRSVFINVLFFTFHGVFKTLYSEMWNVLAVCCNTMVLSARIVLLKHVAHALDLDEGHLSFKIFVIRPSKL